MDAKFIMLVACASASAFAGTWLLVGRAPSATPPLVGMQVKTAEGRTFANCSEVRAAGLAPLMAGRPGYSPALDPLNTGIACPPN